MWVPSGERDRVRGFRLTTEKIHLSPSRSTRCSASGRLDQLHFDPFRCKLHLQSADMFIKFNTLFVNCYGFAAHKYKSTCNWVRPLIKIQQIKENRGMKYRQILARRIARKRNSESAIARIARTGVINIIREYNKTRRNNFAGRSASCCLSRELVSKITIAINLWRYALLWRALSRFIHVSLSPPMARFTSTLLPGGTPLQVSCRHEYFIASRRDDHVDTLQGGHFYRTYRKFASLSIEIIRRTFERAK